MKKYFNVVSAAIFCLCSNSVLCATEETFTYGTPPSNTWGGLPSGTDIGAMNQVMIWEMQHAQNVQAGRSVYEAIQKKRKFCADQPGVIALLKLQCERNALARDEERQKSCTDISLSIGGFGWVNNCRIDSSNTKDTDIADCAVTAQSQINYLNAYCK